ncbi:MAG: Do family serine endopeptidase [Proteobacteria bacterium]|nr:Do family serine endopeptidase [Pseudomonadota bacterium]
MTQVLKAPRAIVNRLPQRIGWIIAAFAWVLLTDVASARADSKTLPKTRTEVELSFAPLVKRAAPAVVNVFSRRTPRQVRTSPFFDDPFFRRFFGNEFQFGRPQQRMESSLGSGVIVRSEGIIVTNHHVVKGSDEIKVALADRREFEAKLILADERTDLAVLKIDTGGEELPVLQLSDSNDLEVGDLVLAIGNPFGVGQTVTSGIVSALARTPVGITDLGFFIQTDAAINPGNSGGALVRLDGKLAGINTAIYSRSGGSMGIGFAIPANMVSAVINGALEGGRLRRPWLGVGGQSVTAEIASSLGLDRPGGIIVSSIYKAGPADLGGLRIGDVIVGVDGREVTDPASLAYRIATRPLGGRATINALRDGRSIDVVVSLIEPPEDPPREQTVLEGRHPLAGATIANLSPALAEELRFSALSSGVIVLSVARGSPASRIGAKPGDLVKEINGEAAPTVARVKQLVDADASTWRVSIQRGDRRINIVIQG